jgi:hypothetical protein
MAAQVQPREYVLEVRRTQLTGSTGRLAAGGQAYQFLARFIVAFVRHCQQLTSIQPTASMRGTAFHAVG